MIYSQLDNPVQWLEHTAEQIGAAVENNRLVLNGSADEGSIRLYPLEDGLTLVLTEVKPHVDISMFRVPGESQYLFMKMYLPDYHLNTAVRSTLDNYQIETPGVMLYNSHLELRSLFKSRQRFKIVSFAMQADWIKRTAHPDAIFSNIELLNSPLFRFEQVSPSVLQSALNLFDLTADTGSFHLRLKAIAYDILSHLFSSFNKPIVSNLSAARLQSDIETIFRVKAQLEVVENGNYPTIDVLAQQAAMSPSKLKTLFRSVFGMSVFEFYQRNRLNYARDLIQTRAFSISEIGFKIGYSNLSKFSRAYKKQFGYLPHQTQLPDRAIN